MGEDDLKGTVYYPIHSQDLSCGYQAVCIRFRARKSLPEWGEDDLKGTVYYPIYSQDLSCGYQAVCLDSDHANLCLNGEKMILKGQSTILSTPKICLMDITPSV
jgi:hypothetical protein